MKKYQSSRRSLKIRKKNNKKKKLILIILLIIVLILGGGVFWWLKFHQSNNSSSTNSRQAEKISKKQEEKDSPTKEIDPQSTKNNDELVAATDQKTTASNTDSTPEANQNSNGSYNIPMNIRIDDEGGQFRISGNSTVQGATVDGKCYATLSGPGGKSITKNMPIMPIGPSGLAYCQAQQISAAELSPGQWSAVLNYESTNAKGISDATIFTVKG